MHQRRNFSGISSEESLGGNVKNEIFHMQVCTYVQTCYAQKTAQKGEKMVSILEYDKEWEEKKLRKAEYEAGKEDGRNEGIEIGKNEGIEIGREEAIAEMIHNMAKCGYSIDKIAEITGRSTEQIQSIMDR